MKQVKKVTLFIAIVMVLGQASMAQKGFQLAVNYNTATPEGTTFNDYVNKTSFGGFQGSVLYGMTRRFRAGVESSFNDFHQNFGTQVYQAPDGSDASGELSHKLKSVPVFAKGEYSILNKGYVKPYVGFGAGVNFVNYDQHLGDIANDQHYTKPAFTGAAGLLVPISRNSNYGFRLSTSYNLMPLHKEGITNVDTWGVQAGLNIPM